MLSAILLLVVAGGAPSLKMSAWLVFYDSGQSMASFERHAADLDTVGAEWIGCDGEGHAKRRAHPNPAQRQAAVKVAHRFGTKILAVASNAAGDNFPSYGIEKALASEAATRQHIAELVQIVKEDGLDGVDLDYESLKASDRKSFIKFVSNLAEALHNKGLILAVALHPKQSEPGEWDGSQAQDYAAIGRAADIVRIMTYDEHWLGSDAGPIASLDWVTQVMKFAVSQIPPGKLEMGIPAYGYDWQGKTATSLTWDDFGALAAKYGPPNRDTASQELTLRYANHVVFFSDGPAQASKFKMAKKLGLRGAAMWRLGSEDPRVWTEFRKAAG